MGAEVAVQFDFGVAVEEPAWFRPLFTRMVKLLDLPPNWNSHGARPVELKALEFALNLLLETMQPESPLPTVLALPRGGVQMEWHMGGIDFEVAVSPAGHFTLYLEGSDRCALTGEAIELEGGLADVRETTAHALAELARRT
jgi:hypothetical protein